MNKASRMLWAYQLRQILPGIILAVIAILLVLWFYLGNALFTIYDEMGKPVQHQVGTVTNIISRPVTRGNLDPAALVSIQVGNKETLVNSHSSLYIGQKLSVDYKIGTSGNLYVDHFLPMVTAK
jgi:hypothetical protein